MSRQLLVVSTLLTLAVTIQTYAAGGRSAKCSPVSGSGVAADAKGAACKAGDSVDTAKTNIQVQLNDVKDTIKNTASPQAVRDKINAALDAVTPVVNQAEKDVDTAQEKVDQLTEASAAAQAKAQDSLTDAFQKAQAANSFAAINDFSPTALAAQTNAEAARATAQQDEQAAQKLNTDLQDAKAELANAEAKMNDVYDGAEQFGNLYQKADNICNGSSGSGTCGPPSPDSGKSANNTSGTQVDNSKSGGSSGNSNDQNKNANNQNGSGSGGSPGSGSGGSSSQSPFQPINMPTATPDPMQQACAVNPRGSGCPGAPQQNFTPATEADKSASNGNGGGDTGMPSSTSNTPMDRIARQAIYGDQMNNLQNQNQLGLPSAGQNMNDSAGRPGNHVGGSANYAMSPSKSGGGGGGSYGGSFGGSNGSGSPGSGAEGGGYTPNSAQSRALAGANTISPSRVANNLRLALMRYHQRSPSSTASVGRDGITGPNTDLWYKVRNRYYSKSAGLNP